MSTKVKGLIKGLKYISHQIFEEEKEADIQIGFPTDVKHVAHIGWDGPSTVDNPSWMNEFKGAGALKSAPLGPPTDSKENPEIKWVSEDSKGRRAPRSESRDAGGEGSTKPRRHSCSSDNTAAAAGGSGGGGDSPKSSKPRQSRRNKASSDGAKTKDPTAADGPDVPKKNRRKKSRDFNADGSVRSARTSKSTATATGADQAQSSQDTTNADLPPSSSSSKPQEDGENPALF